MQENASSGPALVNAGGSDDPTSAGGQRPASPKVIDALISDYFSRHYERKWNEYLKSRWSTLILRWVVGLIGAVLFAAPIVKVILTEETDRQILGQPDGLVFLAPGLLLMGLSLFAALWSRGWPAPMSIAIAIAAFDVYYFETGPELLIPFMIAVAALALTAGLVSYLSSQRNAPKSLAELEGEIDELIASRFKTCLRHARAQLPIPAGRFEGTNVLCLRCFPKRQRLNRPDVMVRIGTDRIPRMSPIGICAFDLGDNDVIVLEGAVDLRTGNAVYVSAHQFAYQDISSLTWESDIWLSTAKNAAGANLKPAPATPATTGQNTKPPVTGGRRGKRPPVVRLESLKIVLKGHDAVQILFQDGSLAKELEDKDFNPVETTGNIRAVWERLSSKRAAAPSR